MPSIRQRNPVVTAFVQYEEPGRGKYNRKQAAGIRFASKVGNPPMYGLVIECENYRESRAMTHDDVEEHRTDNRRILGALSFASY